MPLDKNGLIDSLINVFTSQYEGELSEEQAQGVESLSQEIANAVDTYVKTATVTVSAGITVQVNTGTGTGATTTTGTGSLS